MAVSSETKQDNDIISEINITPMVDIILFLLIIFMVTSSIIMAPSIKVDLPRAANAESTELSKISIIFSRDLKLFLNGKETLWENLKDSILSELKKHKELQAIISADKEVPYGNVIQLIDIIKGLGIAKFA
jgi:biopolymer transport protein ExbD